MPLTRRPGTPALPLSLLAGLLAALTLGACQDPSGVGLGLIGEEGNDPNLVVLLPDSLFLRAEADVTGGFADGILPAQTRALVGSVMDMTFGDASAFAYLDFRPPATVPSSFFDEALVSATLRLERDYVYGDSTAALTFALHEVADEWDPIGAAADTTFEVADELGTYDVTASDSVYSLRLPTSWVTENDLVLRSDSVVTALDGFRLRLDEGTLGGAVVGFDLAASSLRLTNSQDTIDFPIREVFTHIERSDAVQPSSDRLFLRDGAGQVLAFSFPFDSLGEVAVSRATFRLNADPAPLSSGAFARQLPEQLTFYAVTASGSRFSLATATLDEDDDAYYFSGSAITALAQDAALGATTYVRYEIEPARSPTSLDVLPVIIAQPSGEEAERRPRLVLTVVPAFD